MEKTLLSRQAPMLLGTPAESRDFLPLLRWLIIVSLAGFGAIVLWRLGLVSIMLETDRTHISSLILALFVLTSLHCMVQTWFVSSELTQVRRDEPCLHQAMQAREDEQDKNERRNMGPVGLQHDADKA